MKVNIFDKKIIEEIVKKYRIKLLLLFGSRVKEKFLHPESDFDIAYLSERKLSLKEEVDLNCHLMTLFSSDKVDTVDIRKANPLLLYEIFSNHKILFCENKNIYDAFQVYAQRRYFEAKPLFELRDFLLKKFLQKYG